MCQGNGKCTGPYGVCDCFDGFMGADCSLRLCPKGNAWADYAIADETAHQLAECSNRGFCNRETGECECESPLFGGVACERMSCQNNCNLKGRCFSAKTMAEMKEAGILGKYEGCTSAQICQNDDCSIRDYSKCSRKSSYDVPWDADKIFGCLCDSGYSTYDCSSRTCATGDDPLTGTVDSDLLQRNEVQLLECKATFGTFTLEFMGQTTVHISVDASIFEFTEALSELITLKSSASSPKISVQWLTSSEKVCTDTGNDIQITFLQNFGDLPLIVPNGSNLGHVSISQTPMITNQKIVQGTKEADSCSNRGTCDETTGVCTCLENWMTSNGYGEAGTRGDCGYLSVGVTSTCPGEPACLGYGTCSGPPEYRCECQVGRRGPDCALMTCPHGKSWFSFPNNDNDGHRLSECSNMGGCDSNTGKCVCAEGFTGAACEYKTCPGNPQECNGNGECLSMEMLANVAREQNGDPISYTYGSLPNDPLRWDFDQMKGCHCSKGWEGYDCTLRSCPSGDDPQTLHQFNEIQHFSCTDMDGLGELVITFRGESTERISADASASDLELKLNMLGTIGHVEVGYTDPSLDVNTSPSESLKLCSVSSQTVFIEFISPTGDVPLIKMKSATDIDNISVTEHIKGTKEDILCSGRGLCNHATGECNCFTGFASSNGQGDLGSYRDCGYKSPVPLETPYH